jgi:hypothetical protein
MSWAWDTIPWPWDTIPCGHNTSWDTIPHGLGTQYLALTIPTIGPPTSRNHPSNSKAGVEMCSLVNETILSLNITTSLTLKQAQADLKIPKRTFNGKIPISEGIY